MAYPNEKGKGWYADWRLADGRRKRKLYSNKALAEIKEGQEREARERGELGITTYENITFSEWAEYYLKRYSENEKKSWATTDKSIIPNLKKRVGSKYISHITKNDWDDIKYAMKSEEYRPATRNRYLSCLKMIMKFAVEKQKLKENQLSGIKPEDEDNVKDESLELDEMKWIIQQLEDRVSRGSREKSATRKLWYLMQFGVLLGLRKNQLRMLKKEDVFFNRNLYRLIKQKKKKNVELIKPLSPIAKKLFQDYVAEFEPEGDYFFNYSWRSVWDNFREDLKKAGFKKHIKWHSLRHTFATWVGEATGDLRIVQELLSHENIETTQRYSHATDRRQKAAVAALDTYWTPGVSGPVLTNPTEPDKTLAAKAI